jgi:hypothetical protein
MQLGHFFTISPGTFSQVGNYGSHITKFGLRRRRRTGSTSIEEKYQQK